MNPVIIDFYFLNKSNNHNAHHGNALRPQFGQPFQIQMLQRIDAQRMLIRALCSGLQPRK